jgi:UDP-N-acetylmuramoylalanine--D-glutamate ligase
MRSADLAGRTVAVWGLGREGRAALDAYAALIGPGLFGVDDDPDKAQDPSVRSHGIDVLTPVEALERLGPSCVVVKSPGISRYSDDMQAARERGAVVTSGSALWMAENHERVVGVTGSKGKSTTSSLVHHLLNALGVPNTFGGNIGVPLVSLPAAERYVVELSSYQCSDLEFSPDIAAVTSLFPEHLNWHGTADRYFEDKLNIVGHSPRHVVYNAADPLLSEHIKPKLAGLATIAVNVEGGITFDDKHFLTAGSPLFDVSTSPLRGRHNNGNVCVALGVLQASGIDLLERRVELETALRSYAPLEHRLTTIDDPSGLLFVDDSLSTAPHAAVAALEAFPDSPITLIVGGHDRGVDYDVLWRYLGNDQRDLVVIGIPDSGPRILAGLTDTPTLRLRQAADLDEAVALARELTPQGGTVLLSPAAPSYGRYANYEQRSAAFRAAIAATIS